MLRTMFAGWLVTLGVAAARVSGAEIPDDLDSLTRLVKPQGDEAQWANVDWQTNLDRVRKRAVAEDKPILLWRSGGGDVLGRT